LCIASTIGTALKKNYKGQRERNREMMEMGNYKGQRERNREIMEMGKKK
jgi:hypothetical protein